MQQHNLSNKTGQRIELFYVFLLLIAGIIIIRLFYLQIIRHSYYQEQATASQLKQYEIPSERGAIYAYDGNEKVPLVLNETLYRITADPKIISDKLAVARSLSSIINQDVDTIFQKLQRTSRYEIIANKQSKEVKNSIDNLKLQGIFTNEKISQRVYVQGSVAGQLLGFVNDEGIGRYGVEQALNSELTGQPGKVKALTDQNNVPLLASGKNILIDPIDGKSAVLSIDVSMQRQVEKILKSGLKHALSDSGSVVVIDSRNGQVKAMANFPNYDPAKFNKVSDASVFNNAAVSSVVEPGSIMKTLTTAAALDMGAVNKNTSYFDPGYFQVDNATITNVEEVAGSGTRTISDILRMSLNTGATYMLRQMGGGEINKTARERWYDYLKNHYFLGQKTGIEQGFEETGYVPDPNEGYGLNIQYANMSFGQGITVTPLQMAAALASVVNGGTYYRPSLLSGWMDSESAFTAKNPEILNNKVVSKNTSAIIREFMENVVNNNNLAAMRQGYSVGGKTGTAQIAMPGGGYYEDRYNGTYLGFVGGDMPEYVITVRVNQPRIGGYAGSKAAAPIFASVSNMLIDNFTVSRKSN